jgi:hypothetical protein
MLSSASYGATCRVSRLCSGSPVTPWSSIAGVLGGFGATDTFLDAGSLQVVPVLRDKPARPGAPSVPLGQRGLAWVWQLIFHRQGAAGTWRARVDAASGELLELGDLDQYATSRVSGGGVSAGGPAAPDVVRPMPFVQLSAGGYANSAGLLPLLLRWAQLQGAGGAGLGGVVTPGELRLPNMEPGAYDLCAGAAMELRQRQGAPRDGRCATGVLAPGGELVLRAPGVGN